MSARRGRRKQVGETVFGLAMLAFSVLVLWQAYGISGFSALSSPGALPLAAAAIMTVAALSVVFHNTRLERVELAGDSAPRAFLRRVMPPVVVVFIAIVAVFAAILDSLGFLLSALAFLVASIRFLHRRGLAGTLAIAVLALLAIYVVFRLVFEVVLPEGIVPEREVMAWLENLFAAGEAGR